MFTVFISHSTKEPQIVGAFASFLQTNGVNVFVSEWQPAPGTPISEKIQQQMNVSDCVLALLTREGARSISVGQEIGYAKGKKPIIPVVEDGTDVGVLLQGLEYIPFNRANPTEAVNTAINFINRLKLRKEQITAGLTAGLILCGLVLFLWLISRQ